MVLNKLLKKRVVKYLRLTGPAALGLMLTFSAGSLVGCDSSSTTKDETQQTSKSVSGKADSICDPTDSGYCCIEWTPQGKCVEEVKCSECENDSADSSGTADPDETLPNDTKPTTGYPNYGNDDEKSSDTKAEPGTTKKDEPLPNENKPTTGYPDTGDDDDEHSSTSTDEPSTSEPDEPLPDSPYPSTGYPDCGNGGPC